VEESFDRWRHSSHDGLAEVQGGALSEAPRERDVAPGLVRLLPLPDFKLTLCSGWQAGPDTPMLRLLLLLDGEATDSKVQQFLPCLH
jgi:hypothetical protein